MPKAAPTTEHVRSILKQGGNPIDPMISADALVDLFDNLPNVVFFVKDRTGCYTHVNRTLVSRLSLHHYSEVVGRHPEDLFPAPLGLRYSEQDQQILISGGSIGDLLEVHLYPHRMSGWCLTCKYPLRAHNRVAGVVGVSRDLGHPDEQPPIYGRLVRVLEYFQKHYGEPVRMETMAQLAGMSIAQLERHWKHVFQLNPRQMLTKLRMDRAMQLLREPVSVAAIAQACGYGDQSAFTRQFRKLTGVTPLQYRALHIVED
jgi:AraC-like DNA-binding protein